MATNDGATAVDIERGEAANGWYENFYKWLCSNYATIAYSIVILAYFIGFAEYLYLKLTAYFNPEITVYRRFCEKRSEERIGKTGVHYITILVSFIVIGSLQLFAFFLLVLLSKLPSEEPEQQQQQQTTTAIATQQQTNELLFARSVREKMNKTLYPTFVVYIMCSIIVCSTLFYMIGVNDTLDKGLSFVTLIIFDVFVALYFVAFPVIAILYHADITCRRSASSPPPSRCEERSATLQKKNSSPGNTVRLINYTRSPRSAAPLKIPKIVTTV